jgi:glyoxylase-like metal-dependent hydrolase (beta-lactamase superfamily II)
MGNSPWNVEVLLAGSWRGATCTLLSDGRHHIVVDTGMPHEAHLLLHALERRGLHPPDIKCLINTHFHIDHVLNNLAFPHSVIYGSQESYDWCRSMYSDILDNQHWEKMVLKYYPEVFEYERAKGLMAKLRKLGVRWWDAKRLGAPSQFRWIEKHALPEGLEGFVTPGHVPGHASLIVHGGAQATVIAGDALLTREHDEQVITMIPHNREQYHQDRAHILSLPGRILPGHDVEFSTAPDPKDEDHPPPA